MIHFFSLNELSFPRFLILILLGRTVKVLRIAPIVPKLKGTLQRIVNHFVALQRIEFAVNLTPELKNYWDFERRFYFKEVFTKYEPWQNDYYGFDNNIISKNNVYSYAFKQMTCSYTFWKVIEIYLIQALVEKLPKRSYRMHGVLADTIAMGNHLMGDDWAPDLQAMTYPRHVVRLGQVLLSMAYTLSFLVARVRLSVKTNKIDVAFEGLKDSREHELLSEISGNNVFLLIDRFPQLPSQPLPAGLKYHTLQRLDGRFNPAEMLSAMVMALGDIYRISQKYSKAPPALYYEMLTLPYKRLIIRGLLNRFEPRFYIGRDEYNVDHIVRRAELSSRGIKSIGINNGLMPAFSYLAPNCRYVSYDTYYVYAPPLFSQYHNTWATDMKIRQLGSYSVSREKLTREYKHKGQDIVFTIRVAWTMPELVNMVRTVALAFPQRMILLQFKGGFVSDKNIQRLVAECGDGLDNFALTTQGVYELLDRAKYHISDISTFPAEAICTGMITLIADLLDMEYSCYRLFPDLCMTTADQLVEKLKALDSGKEIYPHETYYRLLGHESGHIGYDLLLKEINSHEKTTG